MNMKFGATLFFTAGGMSSIFWAAAKQQARAEAARKAGRSQASGNRKRVGESVMSCPLGAALGGGRAGDHGFEPALRRPRAAHPDQHAVAQADAGCVQRGVAGLVFAFGA